MKSITVPLSVAFNGWDNVYFLEYAAPALPFNTRQLRFHFKIGTPIEVNGKVLVVSSSRIVSKHDASDGFIISVEAIEVKAIFSTTVLSRPGNTHRTQITASAAINLLHKAAVIGNPEAQNMLGQVYRDGDSTPKDEGKAAKWYRKSAEQGYGSAALDLGLLYVNGSASIKNLVEAHAWLNIAVATGDQTAKTKLVAVESKMTAKQIAKATGLATKRFAAAARFSATNEAGICG